MDKPIHFLLLFFGNEVVRVEVLHFTGDLRVEAARIKCADPLNSGASVDDALPTLRKAKADGRDHPHSGDDNSALIFARANEDVSHSLYAFPFPSKYLVTSETVRSFSASSSGISISNSS